ncbi:uncharacterized protein LOC118176763 [Oxyura jamaicensis]|uniref:uncharacterized protein LOC118176763 n=1 Tax=Oxyura jamaicensis TaxID=8884 RepID=UPI0015A6B9F5|nr:uncharacterized protein LOC118176763 [Oxyura jamaicensis]
MLEVTSWGRSPLLAVFAPKLLGGLCLVHPLWGQKGPARPCWERCWGRRESPSEAGGDSRSVTPWHTGVAPIHHLTITPCQNNCCRHGDTVPELTEVCAGLCTLARLGFAPEQKCWCSGVVLLVQWGRTTQHTEPKPSSAGGRGSASCCRDASGHHARAALLRAQARGSIFQNQPLDARRGAGLLTYETRAVLLGGSALCWCSPPPREAPCSSTTGPRTPRWLGRRPWGAWWGSPGVPTHGVPQGALPPRMPCAYSGALVGPHAWGGPIHPKGTLGTPTTPWELGTCTAEDTPETLTSKAAPGDPRLQGHPGDLQCPGGPSPLGISQPPQPL